jgi:predicted AlkP superfamily phosphohydrolase/phosphomutase
MTNRVLIIGWDGATFSVLLPLVEQGVMPNLKALLERGASGPLRSTIPPVTAPAWSSFMTGVNPGKHGVITWQRSLNERMLAKRVVSSQDIQAPRFWEWLEGCSVGLINVPMTYPPMPVNGFVVSGMLTPSSQCEYTYPPHLREFLDRVTGGYVIDVDIEGLGDENNERDLLGLLDRLSTACRKRATATIYLARGFQPDLLIVVFVIPDRIQHILWPYAINAREFAGRSEVVQAAVVRTYKELDTALGVLLSDALDRHTSVILMSDHGFCAQHSVVYMNGWLARQGLLSYRRAIAVRGALKSLYRSVRRRLPTHLQKRGRAFFSADTLIDWKRTQAFAAATMDHGVYINLRGRDPYGIVEPGEEYEVLRERLRQGIAELQDARTGAPIARQVFLREEVYWGPCVDLAPDVVYELNPGYKAVPTPATSFHIEDVSQAGWGFHNREGVLVLAGPEIVSGGKPREAKIEDIAPTVLYMMGSAVPTSMDGRVLTEVFDPSYLSENPPQFTDEVPSCDTLAKNTTYDENEQSIIEARLRNLGYLS